MESSGKAIHTEGGEFGRNVSRLAAQLEPLIPYFGNPASDEAAQIFRRGKEGHPGFDSAYEDLSTALHNLGEAYKHIGSAVVAMSKNVKAADWASMVDKDAYVKDLVEFAQRKNDEISVPTTLVERS
ncbi:hypothetical protein [Nonomuraea basaltis]|uniref:hypothetical protein n=1 Tax=Nonomuraea basaltis TaxID=2495887 RepID=UPI00110C62CD|nr:hypothetical protein [Nonomuraea basaltis]TMR89202.1 hypothetical protein EJK15_62010 [Nonomuraea basaltis]